MFIQVIQGRCRDADRLHQLSDEWRDTLGSSAAGWLGGTYGVTDDGQFVAVVRFESREAAMQNSTRPEQGAWWSKMQECFEGEVTFHDCDDAMLFLGGGSDDAGFVQVIQGRLSDADRFRRFMSQPMDALHEARPEILGGTIAIEPDGTFTETIAFTSEEAARKGESTAMPEDMRAQVEEEFSVMQDVTYLDLRHPWFSSRAAGAGRA
ncbi:hypothetical protein [Marmoricola sp. URHB0036]|uniref:hypothetical protein n=1 Tax=Marmoricola sp. URHB0036 TaxID=1298863 RepID=UPI00042A2D5D|nr:hypothetical protein [Marmoricola sp. URHB0036]